MASAWLRTDAIYPEMRSLTVPTMVVGADADQVPPTAFMEIFALLDGGWMGEGRLTWRRPGTSRR
jgi:hypothetical protein